MQHKDTPPSRESLNNTAAITRLEAGVEQAHEDIANLRVGFTQLGAEVRGSISDIKEAISKMGRGNPQVYLGVAGLMVGGIPLIAGLVYFSISTAVAPLTEKFNELKSTVDFMQDHERDDFELLIRNDQCLIDRGLKSNETEQAMKSSPPKKHKKA